MSEILHDAIANVIKESKIKFNTHKNRKVFIAKIINLLEIDKPASEKSQKQEIKSSSRLSKEELVHPQPNPKTEEELKNSNRVTVMDMGKSAKGDDIAKAANDKRKVASHY